MLEELKKPLTDPMMDLTSISDITLGDVSIPDCDGDNSML